MSLNLFDPHKSFLCLPVVWVTIFMLFVPAIVIGVTIIYYSNLELDLSYEGMNYFITVFRLPLGLLALIIPLVAMLASNHRSEQTKEQIRLANTQNIFSNYYKHLEEFTKYASALNNELRSNDIAIDSRHAHSRFFDNASQGYYGVSESVLTIIDELMLIPEILFSNYHDKLCYPMDDDLYSRINDSISRGVGILRTKGKSRIDFRGREGRYGKVQCLYVSVSKDLIIDSFWVLDKIIDVCKFSSDFVIPRKFSLFKELSCEVYGIKITAILGGDGIPLESRASVIAAAEEFKLIADGYLEKLK